MERGKGKVKRKGDEQDLPHLFFYLDFHQLNGGSRTSPYAMSSDKPCVQFTT